VISSLTVTVLGLIAVSAMVYLLPFLIAYARRVPGIGSIAVINILLGWTLIGWAVALAMACRPVCPPGPVMPPSRPGSPPPLPLPPRPGRPGDRS
jgi:Superinfection immunity protein